MDILNGSLIGGVTIGELSEVLLESPGTITVGGIIFSKSYIRNDAQVWVYNPSTAMNAIVTVPNSAAGDGVSYVIAPANKVPFSEVFDPRIHPTTTILAYYLSNRQIFVIPFTGLKLGEKVNIGALQLQCTPKGLTFLTDGLDIKSIDYMRLQSNMGVWAQYTSPIAPVSTSPQATSFDIDFSEIGIDIATDTLDGQINLAINNPAHELAKLSKIAAEPLTPEDQEFFVRRARGKL